MDAWFNYMCGWGLAKLGFMSSQRNEEAMAEFWEYLSLFFWYHRLVKLLLHLSTGQCELQRICYKRRRGALRTGQVGN
ncbi:hypothetical protein P5673_022058 [Acropora cervicornis]|uniref:Uncharacterized protein n=1 Tax=Acropora cervicornis TaxID=6130 RepID=A0AAD9UZX3_ACRCE|nr:hypothetical protein P5673_022058 [Acropora cervicornis]